MMLDDGSELSQICAVDAQGLRIEGIYRNQTRIDILVGDTLEPYITKRARKGRVLQSRIKNVVLLNPVSPSGV